MVENLVKDLSVACNGLIQSWLNTVNDPNISDKGKLELLAQSMQSVQEWINREMI